MSKEYYEYLDSHIDAVIKAAKWIDQNLDIVKELSESDRKDFVRNAILHDTSKYGEAEYDPYDAYFYGEPDEDAFNRAWLHHIHWNPHHWQHWLLMNDDGSMVALEMPKVYALEMIADWWSFSWRSGNLSEMFGWYEDHKGCIILHDRTREFVEEVLDEIRGKMGLAS